MAAITTSPGGVTEETVAERLRRLGAKRVLVQMAERGQIIDLRCEMPKCYCPKGRGHFDPNAFPRREPWAPSADHYPTLQADGGTLSPGNVRLGHVLCNQQDYLWRIRIRTMLEKKMSLVKIAESLNHQQVPTPHGHGTWSARLVRKAFVS